MMITEDMIREEFAEAAERLIYRGREREIEVMRKRFAEGSERQKKYEEGMRRIYAMADREETAEEAAETAALMAAARELGLKLRQALRTE